MNQKGQTIPLVILLAVMGLLWGLAMTGRQVSQVEETKQTESYNRAFSAAEAGLEEVALRIKEDPGLLQQSIPKTSGNLAESNANYEYECTPVSSTSFVELTPIAKDDVGQVNLVINESAGTYTQGNLDLYWVKGSAEQSSPASLVISLITRGGGGGTCVDNYCLYKYAVNPAGTPRSNGFTGATAAAGHQGYGSKYTLTIPSGEQAQLLRVRAMYNTNVPASVRVEAPTSQFGFQYQECSATGTAGDNQAREKFTISYPSLPSLFDYVLFSGSTITHQ